MKKVYAVSLTIFQHQLEIYHQTQPVIFESEDLAIHYIEKAQSLSMKIIKEMNGNEELEKSEITGNWNQEKNVFVLNLDVINDETNKLEHVATHRFDIDIHTFVDDENDKIFTTEFLLLKELSSGDTRFNPYKTKSILEKEEKILKEMVACAFDE